MSGRSKIIVKGGHHWCRGIRSRLRTSLCRFRHGARRYLAHPHPDAQAEILDSAVPSVGLLGESLPPSRGLGGFGGPLSPFRLGEFLRPAPSPLSFSDVSPFPSTSIPEIDVSRGLSCYGMLCFRSSNVCIYSQVPGGPAYPGRSSATIAERLSAVPGLSVAIPAGDDSPAADLALGSRSGSGSGSGSERASSHPPLVRDPRQNAQTSTAALSLNVSMYSPTLTSSASVVPATPLSTPTLRGGHVPFRASPAHIPSDTTEPEPENQQFEFAESKGESWSKAEEELFDALLPLCTKGASRSPSTCHSACVQCLVFSF